MNYNVARWRNFLSFPMVALWIDASIRTMSGEGFDAVEIAVVTR
jgi:hypothetical protein